MAKSAKQAQILTHVAWLHTMDNTEGLPENKPDRELSFERQHPWGKPGVDFSAEFPVYSQPLYLASEGMRATRVKSERELSAMRDHLSRMHARYGALMDVLKTITVRDRIKARPPLRDSELADIREKVMYMCVTLSAMSTALHWVLGESDDDSQIPDEDKAEGYVSVGTYSRSAESYLTSIYERLGNNA